MFVAEFPLKTAVMLERFELSMQIFECLYRIIFNGLAGTTSNVSSFSFGPLLARQSHRSKPVADWRTTPPRPVRRGVFFSRRFR